MATIATFGVRSRSMNRSLATLSWLNGALGTNVTEPAGRWIEVRTRDNATILVLRLRQRDRPTAVEELPTSNIFYCDDLSRTYDELLARGVEFPQPPVQ